MWREAQQAEAAGRWVCYRQTDGGPETRNPIPTFLSDHMEGHPFPRKCSPNSQICKDKGGIRSGKPPPRASVQGQRRVFWGLADVLILLASQDMVTDRVLLRKFFET